MSCDTASWMNEDERVFARLCTIKLVKRLQGTLSIGIPCVHTRIPDPATFFASQFQILDAHCILLNALSGKLGATQMILRLRKHSGNLRYQMRLLREELTVLQEADAHQRVPGLSRVRESALLVCARIAEFAGILGLDVPYLDDVRTMIPQIISGTASLIEENKAGTGETRSEKT
jgi:hypothetical protein